MLKLSLFLQTFVLFDALLHVHPLKDSFNRFYPFSNFFTDRSNAVLMLSLSCVFVPLSQFCSSSLFLAHATCAS